LCFVLKICTTWQIFCSPAGLSNLVDDCHIIVLIKTVESIGVYPHLIWRVLWCFVADSPIEMAVSAGSALVVSVCGPSSLPLHGKPLPKQPPPHRIKRPTTIHSRATWWFTHSGVDAVSKSAGGQHCHSGAAASAPKARTDHMPVERR
jgi:hypothetical protein